MIIAIRNGDLGVGVGGRLNVKDKITEIYKGNVKLGPRSFILRLN